MASAPLLATLKEGDGFSGVLLALEAAFKVSTKGGDYLEVKLGDASGDLKGFLWDVRAVEGELDRVAPDAFLWVKGLVNAYNGRLQLRLDKVRAVDDAEAGDLGRFFPASRRDVAEMLAELDGHIAAVKDPWIRRLLAALFQEDADLRAAFAKAPAAKSMHHVYLGGLLEHTLSVVGLAHRACDHYPGMNRDLVVAGALLHDLGKTAELTYTRSFGYSDIGNLLGHISLEAQWIQKAVEGLPGFPDELRIQVLHIVLAHHGRLEYGSPVVPKTPEALLVHYLDDLDGKLESMFRVLGADQDTGRWSSYNRALDRMIYRVRWPEVN